MDDDEEDSHDLGNVTCDYYSAEGNVSCNVDFIYIYQTTSGRYPIVNVICQFTVIQFAFIIYNVQIYKFPLTPNVNR